MQTEQAGNKKFTGPQTLRRELRLCNRDSAIEYAVHGTEAACMRIDKGLSCMVQASRVLLPKAPSMQLQHMTCGMVGKRSLRNMADFAMRQSALQAVTQ